MTAHFLRHEYTWSNHCITGNVLGWGMTASSRPRDRELLRELEKTASAAEPDRAGGLPVEELAYVPACGFVKMTVIPWDAGEDNRKNKKVYLWQPEETSLHPGVYLAPTGIWEDEPEEGYLPVAEFEKRTEAPEDIFISMHVYDRLPDFLRAVFWCLFEKKEGLDFAAPAWKKEEFAGNAGRLMYAIHSILPEYLRRRAGYVSYTEQPVSREPFYFSKEPCGANCINLSDFSRQEFTPVTSKLEEYFFYHLSEMLVKKDPLYDRFWEEAQSCLMAGSGGNEERKLFWLFYIFCQKNGREPLEKEALLPGMPELFYWASREPALKETAAQVQRLLHKEGLSPEEREEYMHILLEGFTKRAQEPVCEELDWMLAQVYRSDRKQFEEQLTGIREKNPLIFALLLTRNTDREGTWQRERFQKNTTSFSRMQDYVGQLEKAEIPAEVKNQIILAGIGLLNKDLFKKQNYVQFDALMLRLSRKEQWAEILKEFVRDQLAPEAENLTDAQLKTACYVEQLLKKYAPKEATGVLAAEQKKRRKKEQVPVTAGEADYREVDENEIFVASAADSIKETLLLGYPQGFLTGCVLYLCNYTLMIGHWKIAVGMAGMWLLFMLNYYFLLMHRKNTCPFWKHLGLCILVGYVIEVIPALLLPKGIRLGYFIILGLAAVAVQAYNIFRVRMEEEEE